MRILPWVVAALLTLAAAYFLNLSAFHYWAAGGPPAPNPEWHVMWGRRFIQLSISLLVAAGLLIFLTVRRRRRP